MRPTGQPVRPPQPAARQALRSARQTAPADRTCSICGILSDGFGRCDHCSRRDGRRGTGGPSSRPSRGSSARAAPWVSTAPASLRHAFRSSTTKRHGSSLPWSGVRAATVRSSAKTSRPGHGRPEHLRGTGPSCLQEAQRFGVRFRHGISSMVHVGEAGGRVKGKRPRGRAMSGPPRSAFAIRAVAPKRKPVGVRGRLTGPPRPLRRGLRDLPPRQAPQSRHVRNRTAAFIGKDEPASATRSAGAASVIARKPAAGGQPSVPGGSRQSGEPGFPALAHRGILRW